MHIIYNFPLYKLCLWCLKLYFCNPILGLELLELFIVSYHFTMVLQQSVKSVDRLHIHGVTSWLYPSL